MDSKRRRRLLQRTKSVSRKTWDSYGEIEKMPIYYELMIMSRRGSWRNLEGYAEYEFKDGNDLDEKARNVEVDSESMTVSTAISIIHWLLKHDEGVKGKYTFKKKK